MIMSVEQSVEWVSREIEVLGENLPHCYFVHHNSHMNWPRARTRIVAVELNITQATTISIYVNIQFVPNLCHLIAVYIERVAKIFFIIIIIAFLQSTQDT
jgi:hypothetical protein